MTRPHCPECGGPIDRLYAGRTRIPIPSTVCLKCHTIFMDGWKMEVYYSWDDELI